MTMGSKALVPPKCQGHEDRDATGSLPRYSKSYVSEGTLRDHHTNRAKNTPPPRRAKIDCISTPVHSETLTSGTNEDDDVVDAGLQEYLQGVVLKNVHRDLPIVEFIYLVYKFGPDDLPDRKVWTLPKEACLQFCRSKKETNSYDHLYHIFDSLHQQLYDPPPPHRIPVSNYTSFNPDYTLSTIMHVLWRRWSWIFGIAYGEVKRTSAMHELYHYTNYEFDTQILWKEFAQSKSCQERMAQFDRQMHEESRGDLKSSDHVTARAPTSGETATIPTTSTAKRKEPSWLGEDTSPSRKRMRFKDSHTNASTGDRVANLEPSVPRPLTSKELQSLKYINDRMSEGFRSYGTGWLLDDTRMTLWYADQMGIVQSASFDILNEPHYLLLLVAAMSSADANDMGVCPLINMHGKRIQRYARTTVEIDRAETYDGQVEDLKFRIVNAHQLYTEFGAVGRGTTVVPIRPIDSSTSKLLGLVEGSGDEQLVVKISWPLANRIPEFEHTKKIRRRLKSERADMLKHIVDVKCFLQRTMLETQLPRVFMDIKEIDRCDERQLCCLVMKRYKRLEMVNDAEELKQIFADVVRAHHWVYETSGVLHRDVSVGNVMFYRELDSVVGVLCDWDRALDTLDPHLQKSVAITEPLESEMKEKSQRDDESPDHQGPKHFQPQYLTGTRPFMAFDLLQTNEVPFQIYRFDLESFFWLLAYFCAVIDPTTHTYKDEPSWECPNLYLVGQNKRKLLEDDAVYDSTFEHADPRYRGIIDGWLYTLRQYLQPLTFDMPKIQILRERIDNAVSKKDARKEADARQKLEALQKKREKLVTYKGFMSALGLDEEGLPLQ